MIDPLRLLERADKHYLGSGTGMIFAPRFPCWLDWPGFWDEVDIYNYQVAPLFTVTFLRTDSGKPSPLKIRQSERSWSPAELVGHYTENNGTELYEVKLHTFLGGGYLPCSNPGAAECD